MNQIVRIKTTEKDSMRKKECNLRVSFFHLVILLTFCLGIVLTSFARECVVEKVIDRWGYFYLFKTKG